MSALIFVAASEPGRAAHPFIGAVIAEAEGKSDSTLELKWQFFEHDGVRKGLYGAEADTAFLIGATFRW